MTSTSDEEPLRIWWNKNLDKKISRGKLAAHAAHAALAAYGIEYTHPIVVLAAGKAKIEAMPVTIHDSGYTELEPGTLTTGVDTTAFTGLYYSVEQVWSPEEIEHFSNEQDHYVELATKQYNKLQEIREWAERHAEHAGRAPLSELREILDRR